MTSFDAEFLPPDHPKVVEAAAALRELRQRLRAVGFSDTDIAEALLSEALATMAAQHGAQHVACHLGALGKLLIHLEQNPPPNARH
jgi:hypothetical protein